MSTLWLPPSTTAPMTADSAPTAMNGVAAPSSLRRSSTAPTPRNPTPMTSATAAVVSVLSFVFDNEVVFVSRPKPKSVLELPLLTWFWNGMRVLLPLPATSKVSQIAKIRSAPARKIARPLVQPTRYSAR